MSLPVEERSIAALRAWAHPLRLRMLSLLTGAAMSAAELARELDVSQALASYHLRQLADAEVVELAEERSRRGGRERRYRYRAAPSLAGAPAVADPEAPALYVAAMVEELRRRSAGRTSELPGLTIDAELWVSPQDWEQVRQAVEAAGLLLHERARPPREPGTVHVNTTVAMFSMAGAVPTRAPRRHRTGSPGRSRDGSP